MLAVGVVIATDSPTDAAGRALAGWAFREAVMRREAATPYPLHVQLDDAPFVRALPDGQETVYHAPEAML